MTCCNASAELDELREKHRRVCAALAITKREQPSAGVQPGTASIGPALIALENITAALVLLDCGEPEYAANVLRAAADWLPGAWSLFDGYDPINFARGVGLLVMAYGGPVKAVGE